MVAFCCLAKPAPESKACFRTMTRLRMAAFGVVTPVYGCNQLTTKSRILRLGTQIFFYTQKREHRDLFLFLLPTRPLVQNFFASLGAVPRQTLLPVGDTALLHTPSHMARPISKLSSSRLEACGQPSRYVGSIIANDERCRVKTL